MSYVFDFNDAKAYEEWSKKPRNRFAADLENRLHICLISQQTN